VSIPYTRLGLTRQVWVADQLENLPALVEAMPSFAEASIGHELTADALEMGFERAVVAYKAALRDAAV
jgi:pyridoxine 5-phosphate synthase